MSQPPLPFASSPVRYRVQTWDTYANRFTPQKGVRIGPYSKWALRKPLRALQSMGYDTSRPGGCAVLVERISAP